MINASNHEPKRFPYSYFVAQPMINFLFHSIKGKLLLSFFLLLGIALLFQFAYIAPTLQKSKIEAITKSQDGFAEYLAGEINSRLEEAIKELEEMASLQHFVFI